MDPDLSDLPAEAKVTWADRERYWRRRLSRLRLDAEPIEDQLARYRRVTWAITVVLALLAGMFIALFTAFARPDLGALIAAILFGPMLLLAWLDSARLQARATAYLREREQYESPK